MAETRRRPKITETVGEVDGKKVLIIRADGEIIAVQPKKIVAQRIATMAASITDLDEGLAKTDAEHLAAVRDQIDRHIEKVEARREALTAESVALAVRGRLRTNRDRLAAQKVTLDAIVDELSDEESQAPATTG